MSITYQIAKTYDLKAKAGTKSVSLQEPLLSPEFCSVIVRGETLGVTEYTVNDKEISFEVPFQKDTAITIKDFQQMGNTKKARK